ncbi:hypothetical protein RCH09_003760 [Actimicrobium sp. GrIS 1.19]|nr:hypothetical protein [Actimicrobium sp. GrIS 1.19]
MGFVTPSQRHARLDAALLRKRTDVYEAAKKRVSIRESPSSVDHLVMRPLRLDDHTKVKRWALKSTNLQRRGITGMASHFGAS